ncbi:MAG: sulfur-carrier protein adenylyltransferase/sulfurtransferase [Microbacteriaceae bacterium]|nr:sulfur-carrier protein adenylyltransferase/sulfurtransferase [Microbacteriaceae bacterium]
MAGDVRFARQAALPGFGTEGQRRLASARVAVVGAGGLGSALLPVLAAAGVGALTVIDGDVVERSNLHRQTLHTEADVGRPKAASALDALVPLAPAGTVVRAVETELTADNASAVLAGADLLVDATDSLPTRYLLDDRAEAAGIPLVWGSATGYAGQVGVSTPSGPRWRDLFPVPPAPDSVETCAIGGVLPSVCTTVGGLMATEVLKLLAGVGRPLAGRVLVVDALSASVREIAYSTADGLENGTREVPMAAEDEDMTVEEVSDLLADGGNVQLVDVREPWEAEIASLPGSTLIPLGTLGDRLAELDPDRPVVAYCHAGVRSARAAERLRAAGFRARSMAGGIDRWSRTVDPSVPRY